ncbi:MAG: DNA repair protein RecN [Fibrobacterota bacterium]
MLTFLSIRDYALIEKLDIEFGEGFNVITGETGAGKSIIIEALSLLLGERAQSDTVRHGKEKAVVQGTFTVKGNSALLKKARDLGFDADEGEIIVRREISTEGRNRCFVNGINTPLQSLKVLGDLLVDVHGQNDHQSLVRPETHIGFLDGYAGTQDLLDAYASSYKELKAEEAKLAALIEKETRIRERKEFLEFQHKTLAAAELRDGREAELGASIKYLESGHKTADLLAEARGLVDDGLLVGLQKAAKAMRKLSEMDASFKEAAEKLSEAGMVLEDLSRALQKKAQAETPVESLDELNAKLAAINRLKRKYGRDEAGLVNLFAETVRDLEFLGSTEIDRHDIEKAIRTAKGKTARTADELSAARKKAAKQFDKKVNLLLSEMNMAEAGFATEIADLPAFSPDGRDGVEFKIRVNPGEPVRPLVKIASGGEISRVMLAVKSALAEKDDTPVLIFDEIDTGIGGETAGRLGALLRSLARFHQLFCITHAHQIAKEADRHYSVEKESDGQRTVVRMAALSDKERVAEIARMLGGGKARVALDHARSLVRERA